MNEESQHRITTAARNPDNLGEMADADSIGTVGNTECGEMFRVWVKFKEVNGKKVIDRATFQSFGCETAIAVAALATELIRGKTPEEALSMSGAQLSDELGPLPPMKIHCAELVHGALRSALAPDSCAKAPEVITQPATPASSLLDHFASKPTGSIRVVLLEQPPLA